MTPGVPLCHHCWSWVIIKNGHCPACRSRIPMEEPDPSPDILNELFGIVHHERTAVTAMHPTLPEFGSLFACENGLLFLPYLAPLGNGVIGIGDDEPIRGNPFIDAWRWLTRPGNESARTGLGDVVTNRPQDFADAFMNSPGAWFALYQKLSRVERNRQRWRLTFRNRDPITLTFGTRSEVTRVPATPANPKWPDVAPLFTS